MKSLRRTLRWLLFLVLLGGAGGGAYVYYYWNQGDELLRQAVLTKLEEQAPGWNIEIGRARFDFAGRIRLHDVRLRVPEHPEPFVEIPEVVLVVDRDRITEKNPPVHQIRLLGPRVQLVRNAQGQWSWEGLPPRPKLGGTLSEWQVEQATLSLRLEGPPEAVPFTHVIRDVEASLIPSGKRQYVAKVAARFELATAVSLEGNWNLDTGAWSVGGSLQDLKVGPDLATLVTAIHPDVQTHLNRAAEWGAKWHRGPRSAADVFLADEPVAMPPAFGLNATVDTRFRVAQWEPGADYEYKVSVQLQQGEAANPLLPFALYELRGGIVCDNQQVVLTDLTARNGGTQLKVGGKIIHKGDAHPTELTVALQDLVLEDRVYNCLTGECRKFYESLDPSGKIDFRAKLNFNGRDHWDIESDLDVKGCTLTHAKFPYQVDQVTGTVQQRDDLLDITLRGMAGSRPVSLRGRVKRPGPDAETAFDIRAQDFPIDEKFRAACPPKVQAAIDTMRAQGTFDGRLVLTRPAGPGQKYTQIVTAQLKNCTSTPKSFPYVVTNVSGMVEGTGEHWTFRDLRGMHDKAAVTASGTLAPNELGEAELTMTVGTGSAAFDPQLLAALPEVWQTVWKEFNPTGKLDALARVNWSASRGSSIALDATLVDAGLSMKSFPWPLEQVQAQVELGQGKLTIKSLKGRHEETRVAMTGWGWFEPGGEWLVHLEDLKVDDLDPDSRFRKALPAKLRGIVDTLDPRHGKLTANGMLEFRGTGQPLDPVTAAWDLETIYSGSTLTTGIDLENVHGRAHLRGTWDGERVRGTGAIDLDSVSFRGYQLTNVRGPVSVDGTRLVLGSEDVVNGGKPAEGPAAAKKADRLTAKFIDGTLALDGVANLEGTTDYHVRMTLTSGRLERFAQLYLPGRDKLMGVMRGWVDLTGRGPRPERLSGRGQLLIEPAALYELPVMVAIFKVLSFVPPDKTAFTSALLDFDVGGSQFQFRRIDLQGDSLSLHGRGTVNFDGHVNLDFYSMVGRYQVPIPLVRELIAETSKGWVAVEVTGTTKMPLAKIRPGVQMDDALRNFFNAFDNRPPLAPPLPSPPASRERPARTR